MGSSLRHYQKKLPMCIAAASVILSSHVYADVDIKGYASIVAGMTLNDDKSFVAEPIGGGVYDGDLSFRPESLFALQISSEVVEGVSVVAQLVGRGANDFETRFEWAYVDIEIDQSWSVQAGRQGLVFYQFSDYLDAGYAYNFFRTPSPLYIIPINSYEGINVRYEGSSNSGWDYSANFYIGESSAIDKINGAPFQSDLLFEKTKMKGINVNFAKEEFSVRLGVHTGELDFIAVSAVSAGQALDGGGLSITDFEAGGFSSSDTLFSAGERLVGEGNAYTFLVGGASYNWESVLLNYEFYFFSDDIGFNNQQSHSVNVGYSMGKWTPTVSYSIATEKQASERVGTFAKGIPATQWGLASFTLRYELKPTAALKFDVTRSFDRGDIPFIDETTVVAAGLDIVF